MEHVWITLDGPWNAARVAVYECAACGERRIVLALKLGEPLGPPATSGQCPGVRRGAVDSRASIERSEPMETEERSTGTEAEQGDSQQTPPDQGEQAGSSEGEGATEGGASEGGESSSK